MRITRRRFLETSAGAGATIASARFFPRAAAAAAPPASPPDERVVPMPTGEWMSPSSGTAYRAYRSKYAKSADATTWVRDRPGEKRTIDSVKVYPANDRFVPGQGFPLRFKIEASSEPEFRQATAIVSHLDADVPNPEGAIQKYPAAGVECRYVRLTATRLPQIEPRRHMADENGYYLAIGKMDVYSGGKNIAELCPVTADAAYGNDDDLPQVTRPERAGRREHVHGSSRERHRPKHVEAAGSQGEGAAHWSDAQRRGFPDGDGEEHSLSPRLLLGG